MDTKEKLSMTRALWLIKTLYQETRDIEAELAEADEEDRIIHDTKSVLSKIEEALAEIEPAEAELFRARILTGEAFKGVCYGDALTLTEEEEKACNSFGEVFNRLEAAEA